MVLRFFGFQAIASHSCEGMSCILTNDICMPARRYGIRGRPVMLCLRGCAFRAKVPYETVAFSYGG